MKKLDWERVINFIPVGKENAISRQALSELTCLNDRANRQAIEDARRNGIKVISRSSSRGYYIADNDTDWLDFLNEHRRRALSELSIYNEGIRLVTDFDLSGRVIPVKAHLRHLKTDTQAEGQMALEV